MLSKNQIKFINSLHQKKFRDQHKLFIAEGFKTISEVLNSNIQLHELYVTESLNSDAKQVLISENELKKISALKTPNKALGIFKIPVAKSIDTSKLIVALDTVRDPGNLGTIIRLCDWFGVRDLVCSKSTVDCYNPKVIQATMGSFARVNISYIDLEVFLKEQTVVKYGTFMKGDNLYEANLSNNGILVMGNEANGISKNIEELTDYKLAIPRFGKKQETESLNVATATAILLSEFRRNSIEKSS